MKFTKENINYYFMRAKIRRRLIKLLADKRCYNIKWSKKPRERREQWLDMYIIQLSKGLNADYELLHYIWSVNSPNATGKWKWRFWINPATGLLNDGVDIRTEVRK